MDLVIFTAIFYYALILRHGSEATISATSGKKLCARAIPDL